jgi:hypothetical protein
MAHELPHPENIRERFRAGIPMGRQEVQDLTNYERIITGRITRGGPSAVAQSCYAREQRLAEVANQAPNDPDPSISQEDVSKAQSAEVRPSSLTDINSD